MNGMWIHIIDILAVAAAATAKGDIVSPLILMGYIAAVRCTANSQ